MMDEMSSGDGRAVGKKDAEGKACHENRSAFYCFH
jgi:hypothetical protein